MARQVPPARHRGPPGWHPHRHHGRPGRRGPAGSVLLHRPPADPAPGRRARPHRARRPHGAGPGPRAPAGAGPPRSGRSTALETVLASLGTGAADAYVAGSTSSPLRRLGLPGRTAFGNSDELAALAGELLQVVQIYPEVLRVLVIDDADRLLEDMGLSSAFDALARCDPV